MTNLEFTEKQLKILKSRISYDLMQLNKVNTDVRPSLKVLINRAKQDREDLLATIETKLNGLQNADSQTTTSKIKKGSQSSPEEQNSTGLRT